MFPDVKQMFSFIKMRGYKQTKDVLGTYFDKGNHKLTINKQANWFICFNNVKKADNWELINKSPTFDNFQAALYWVAKEIEKQSNI